MLDLGQPWIDIPICVVDFEATGTDPLTCEPVEVSAVRFERGTIAGKFTSLLRPTGPIPAEASAIHGITAAEVKSAPTLDEVSHELARLSLGAVPCAYNAHGYDRVIMHRYLTGTDVPLFDPSQEWLDPLIIVREHDRYESSKKLADACARRGIHIGNAHRAESDAIACGKLLHVMMGKKRPTMAALLARMATLRIEQRKEWMLCQLRKWIDGEAEHEDLEAIVSVVEEIKRKRKAT